jgi:flagellar assembly protein FliH
LPGTPSLSTDPPLTGRGAALPFAALALSTGFQSDARYAAAPDAAPQPEVQADDPIATAWAEGYLAGSEQAEAEAAQQAILEAGAHEALSLSFAKLDRELEEALRQRLHDTVAALCEAALAPLALDEAALFGRIERAIALFTRADDERVIRLHPDDLALISQRLAEDWQVVPDPMLERGALRVEAANGGVEDGPAQWRQAIAEALALC